MASLSGIIPSLKSGCRKFYQQLKKTDKNVLLETAQIEAWFIALYGFLPAIVCTYNSVVGIDVIFPMWLMVVVLAYCFHRKRMSIEKFQDILCPEAWARYIGLLTIIGLASWLSPSSVIIFEIGFYGITDIGYRLLTFHVKVCQHIALYRLYLSIFGNVATTVKKNCMANKNLMSAKKS